MPRLYLLMAICGLWAPLASCQRPAPPAPQPRAAKPAAPPKLPPLTLRKPKNEEEPLREIAESGALYVPSPTALEERLGGVNEEVAVARIVAYLRDAAELDPTVVVWLLDRSQSASRIVFQTGRHLQAFYTDIAKGRIPHLRPRDAEPRLLSAVVSFGRDVQFPLAEPTGDPQAVLQALADIPVDQDPREATFAALAAAVERYLPYRTQHGRRLALVVVTDEAGDDADRVEEVLEAPRKYAVPVYVIGAPAPFGRVTALPTASEGAANLGAAPGAAGPPLRHGPESLHREQIDLPTFAGLWRNDVLESGFGPFALERLCRATGGEFILLQPPAEGRAGGSLADWPSPFAVRFDKQTMRRYAPDYVPPEAYQRLLEENAARMALHRAAQVEESLGTFAPQTEFPRASEAELQRRINDAQRTAARLAPPVDRMYELLQQGEAARPALAEPRWQAGFDLALGRAAAAKARIDGYNVMLAILKRGRNFERPDSTRWLLEPADATEAGSAVERLIVKARAHLERVAAEHPRTPWAYLAQQELEAKLGWQWTER